MIQLMSHDENIMPDALAGLAASTAIQLSDIPFEYPISEVRVATQLQLLSQPAASDRPTTQLDNNPSIARDHPEQIEKANQRCRVPPPRLRLIRTTVQSLYTGSEPPAFNMLSDPGEAQFNFRDCCEQRALPLTQSFFAG
jgi:hypothetical protein